MRRFAWPRPARGRGHGGALCAATARPAHGSRFLRIGIYDEAQTLYGPVDQTFATLAQLHVQEIRLNLYWGGKFGVAKSAPAARRPIRTTRPTTGRSTTAP